MGGHQVRASESVKRGEVQTRWQGNIRRGIKQNAWGEAPRYLRTRRLNLGGAKGGHDRLATGDPGRKQGRLAPGIDKEASRTGPAWVRVAMNRGEGLTGGVDNQPGGEAKAGYRGRA